MFGAPTSSNYFNSYSSLEPDQAVRMNGDGRTLSAPDIARNTMRGGHSGSNSNSGTLSSAARRRMEDRMFTRKELLIWYKGCYINKWQQQLWNRCILLWDRNFKILLLKWHFRWAKSHQMVKVGKYRFLVWFSRSVLFQIWLIKSGQSIANNSHGCA